MNSRVLNILLLFIAPLHSILSVEAQSYERVQSRNIWNEGRNVTGLRRDSISASNAEIYYRGEQGDFRSISDASELWSVGAEAHGISHLGGVSMMGSFAYEHTHGEDMSGSMFIQPNAYPFDLLEFTPGEKTLQSYYIMGGVTSEVAKGLSIGVKGYFEAQNYAKFKDLRHYNYRMELSLVPSAAYSFGDVTVGASYIYERNSETVRAQEVGSTAAAYYAFLNKGLMSGAYETWGGSGIHLDESGVDGFPVRENFNGGAVQFAWRGLYADLEMLKGQGEVGEKQTYWFDFPSLSYTARVGYSQTTGNRTHLYRVVMEHNTLTNNENVVGTVTENGVSTTKVFGSTKIFESQEITLNPHYRMIVGSGGDFEIGLNYSRVFNRSTQMYPYVEESTTNVVELNLGGMYPVKRFEIRASAQLSAGDISEQSYRVSSDIEAADAPTHLSELYNLTNEYLTATRLTTNISLRYNLPLSLYCEAGVGYTHAFDLSYIAGAQRWAYRFKIGYNF